jgi:hypothetical protein
MLSSMKKEQWDWKITDGEKYNFLPILDEEKERYENHQTLIVTPPQTPMSLTFPPFSFFFLLLLVEAQVVTLYQVH